MGNVLHLVPTGPSKDTVEALEEALAKARSGEAIGVAIMLVLSRDVYQIDIAGELRRHPTYGRGMAAALDDHLADLS